MANIGYLIRCKGDKFEVWDREKKSFIERNKIPSMENDGTTIEHIIDLYHITRRYGILTAFKYDARSTRAHLFNEVFEGDARVLNFDAKIARERKGE